MVGDVGRSTRVRRVPAVSDSVAQLVSGARVVRDVRYEARTLKVAPHPRCTRGVARRAIAIARRAA
eukprot:2911409-Prymnesium_polylepis.1